MFMPEKTAFCYILVEIFGLASNVLSTFSIVGHDTTNSYVRFSSLCMRREPNPLARSSAIHFRSRSEIRTADDVFGRRD
jgi:hypothetical protein